MENITAALSSRSTAGKGVARKLRAADKIPAVLYGMHKEPTLLSAEMGVFQKLYRGLRGSHRPIDISIDGNPAIKVILKDFQRDPITDRFLHADFYELSMTEKMIVEVPIRFNGEPAGVKLGGILELIQRTVDCECLPADIPERIELDISGLLIGTSIHVRDLVLPTGVVAKTQGLQTLVTVVGATKEEEKAVAADATPATDVPAAKGAAPAAKDGAAPAAAAKGAAPAAKDAKAKDTKKGSK